MSKIKDLVPPLELCKLIPDGKFADSVFQWLDMNDDKRSFVVLRGYVKGDYPAPTLEEIMAALPASNCWKHGKTWTSCFINDSVSAGEDCRRGVVAAMKLYLKYQSGLYKYDGGKA